MTLRINRSFFLLLCDLLAILTAYAVGFYLRTGSVDCFSYKPGFLYLSLIVFPLLFYIFDLYYPFRRFTPGPAAVDVLLSAVIGMVVTAAVAYADRSFVLPRLIFIYTTLLLALFIFLLRMAYDAVGRSRLLNKPVLVVGTGPLAMEIVRLIKEIPHSGMELAGLVTQKKSVPVKSGMPIVGPISDLLSLIDWYKAKLVVLALEPSEETSDLKVFAELLERRIPVTSSIHLFEKLSGDVPYKLLGAHYLLGLMAQVKVRPYLKLKRVIDVLGGALLFMTLSPILFFCMALLALSGPRKIFFYQERIGKDSLPFKLIKLRTMATHRNGEPKVTKLGRWMRKYRVDEIPQLINVLKGEMSLIGPRPEIPYFVNRCRRKIPFYSVVFSVKPGLTGWAQVKFRHATSLKDYELKFRFNLYYLKNISLALDLLIILKTVRVVLLGKGK